jgi:hypothetical protein
MAEDGVVGFDHRQVGSVQAGRDPSRPGGYWLFRS